LRSKAQQEEIVRRALAMPNRQTPEPAKLDLTDGRIVAVEICSSILEAHIWLAFDDGFNPPSDGQAVFYRDELQFLATKDAEQLREIHKNKLIFGGRVRQ
jgi:hypothetical protein